MSKEKSVFQHSQRQIVALVMTIFLLLFAVTLASIYIISYHELYQTNLEMLKIYSDEYKKYGNPYQREDAEKVPQENFSQNQNSRYLHSAFYSAAFATNEQLLSIDPGIGILYAQEKIESVARELLDTSRNLGTYDKFVYFIDYEETYTLVVLMDNTLISDSFTTIFRNALIIGSIMVIILFLCAAALARWIIKPLKESDRKQRQFISDAGHELKTPVSVIEANAELLEREIGDNKWLENIRSESGRMTELVSELLALARTERSEIETEQLNLSRLVLGRVLPFESVAFEMGRNLDCQIDEDITIEANTGQLNRLISILMDNALSHSSGEGDIAINLCREKTVAILTISNPGFIAEENREAIFDRFFRTDTERGNSGHYGLGLTIAKNIVTAHRGEIYVSCADGRVIFTVRLPIKDKTRCRLSENSC